jgi:hypothetical protein
MWPSGLQIRLWERLRVTLTRTQSSTVFLPCITLVG